MKTILLCIAASLALIGAAHAASAPSMSTGSLGDNRSLAECLDYSAKVMRVLEIEHIRMTHYSVYGQSPEINFVIRCEIGATGSRTVFFAAAGGDDPSGFAYIDMASPQRALSR
jgi:hypothetical protein